MRQKFYLLILHAFFLLTGGIAFSQKPVAKKYPSLFWEITGNGLKKPSYLFGTMHVSSKMVFHLSDSFYYAMKNVDAVALELNPDLWQGQMVRLDRLKENYANFAQLPGGDFLNKNSFQITGYDKELKLALSTEPTAVNSLLYRTYKAREDFEEDTFLDLYIFQTGKKLGKRSAGVEDYNETEKVVLEAYADMAREKKKRNIDTDGESVRDIGQKIQDAYRSGDLDLMDSLDMLTERSNAFREKFLYKRNEIQASSIDTILKRASLFVGVGAAHLPGPRGVIELLRKMGYALRPIKITGRDAVKKEETDQLKVPVTFSIVVADDEAYTVSMPGPLFKMKDEYLGLDRRQYADMSNGSFYLVTRVKTFATFLGQSQAVVLKKVDSLLYENIPGKILKKTRLDKNGCPGFDIINKTRRGDLQRYNIFVTPYEILIFKMSGKENYIEGKEAAQFFSSIRLSSGKPSVNIFTPSEGGFSVKLPQVPSQNLDAGNSDGMQRWEYQAGDTVTGDAYLILKKTVYNFKFLEEDTFDLKLIEESFRSPEYFDKQISRTLTNWLGYPCLEVKEQMKNGDMVTARLVIQGPHYYCIAARSKNNQKDFGDYFNSFRFTPYRYPNKNEYVDTFLHFAVTTPVAPDLDEAYRAKLEKVTADVAGSNTTAGYHNYWPKSRNALFTSDSTGESVGVSIQQYPQYYSVKDSLSFWKNQIGDYYDTDDLLLTEKKPVTLKNGATGYRFSLRDTGSSRTIDRMILLKENYLYSLVTIGDTIHQPGSFIDSFFYSFTPEDLHTGKNIFASNLDTFFTDLLSNDSATSLKARQKISNIYFGENGAPKIIAAMKVLKQDKYYTDSKAKLIAELGYINDTSTNVVVGMLKKIYIQTADSSIFQNEVMKALARHKTNAAIKLFKELVLQDPPLFENDYDYTTLFNNLAGSLPLAATLYPELLQLAAVEDYKKPVTKLLVTLVDSGYIKNKQLTSYFTKIYFDSKIALKKQMGKDEKKTAEDKSNNNDYESNTDFNSVGNNDELTNYAILLMPFFNSNATVPKFFKKLLQSKDEELRLNTAMLLLKNKKAVADSIINWFAAKDKWRGDLYTRLEEINQLNKFPAIYKTQTDMARSYLVADKAYNKVDSVIYVSHQPINFRSKKGFVYFFKYRVKKDDDWKIGISGIQPENLQEVSSNNSLCVMTDKKLKPDQPQDEQFQRQLKQLLFTLHKSGRNFFEGEANNYHFTKVGEHEEH
ncbi:MAG: TraB/GumN family protein [Aquabacterium sp.]|nr:TraB/GumN family protein [Ferruginibacter sp.]